MIPVPDEEIVIARRRVEKLVADSALSDLEALSDDRLEESISHIEDEERGVSDSRSKVFEVHDQLQEEMKRRLRAELSNLPS